MTAASKVAKPTRAPPAAAHRHDQPTPHKQSRIA